MYHDQKQCLRYVKRNLGLRLRSLQNPRRKFRSSPSRIRFCTARSQMRPRMRSLLWHVLRPRLPLSASCTRFVPVRAITVLALDRPFLRPTLFSVIPLGCECGITITVNGHHTFFSHIDVFDLPSTSVFSSANSKGSSTNVVRLVVKVTSYSYGYSYSADRYPSVNCPTPSASRWQLALRLEQLRSASASRSKTRMTFTELGFYG